MARKKTPPKELATFQMREIDAYAVEVSEGMVKVEGIDQLIPLDTYLQNKERSLDYLRQKEKELYIQCQRFIQDNLPLRQGQFQEDCRMLSWAYANQSNQAYLKGLLNVCPKLHLLTPSQSIVQGHHLSHFIRAYFALLMGLPPRKVGPAANLVGIANEVEEMLQSRITTWEYLLSLTPTNQRREIEFRQLTPIEQILKQQENILKDLKEIKLLLKEQANNGKATEDQLL